MSKHNGNGYATKADVKRLAELAGLGSMYGMPASIINPAPVPANPPGSDESKWIEIGATGLKLFAGFIHEAYNAELNWPNVFPLYSRIWRSDSEMTITRQLFKALSRKCSIEWELPDDATDGDKAAQDFAYECMDDVEGGPSQLLEQAIDVVGFGWGWWEVLPGLRSSNWRPPEPLEQGRAVGSGNYQGPEDEWRSQFDDGRIGFRRFAARNPSSFWKWDFQNNRTVKGMVQRIPPGYPPPLYRTIPRDRSLHLRFGDTVNPEGLSPLEAIWRLERIKYGLEVINGIGFEHSAGYLNVNVQNTITPEDQTIIQNAARAIMSAQEGNYAVWPNNVQGEVKDINFQAAAALHENIKYYGILKLQIFNMGWAAMSTTSSHGSLASMQSGTDMFILFYNSMMEGFADQMDAQIGRRLFEWNSGAFPGMPMRTGSKRAKSFPGKPTQDETKPMTGMTARPRLTITPIEKVVNLQDLGQFLSNIQWMKLGDDDIKAIRKQSGFLPETLPPEETTDLEPQPEPQPAAETTPPMEAPASAQMARGVLQQLFDFGRRK